MPARLPQVDEPQTAPPRFAPDTGSRDVLDDRPRPRHGVGSVPPAGGAVAAGRTRHRRRRAGWLLPLLGLLLVALLALAAFQIFGADDSSISGDRPAPADEGTLMVEGWQIAPGAPLRDAIGQDVTVTRMKVQSVTGTAGFWVGPSGDSRTWVEFRLGIDAKERGSLPEQGDTVTLSGPIARPPKQPGRTFHIPVADERAILAQGGYINPRRVTPAR